MVGSRLALGTVQFGLPYGVVNDGREVETGEAAAILRQAWASGVNTLDTAIVYGESERRLGEIGVAGWRIVTKLPAVPENCPDVSDWVERSVDDSMARLGVPRLSGLLLHRPHQLLEPAGEDLFAALLAQKDRGVVDKIGISIYGPDELQVLFARFAFDLVQAPLNVVDRRLVSSGWLDTLYAAGTEVHVRSVFLQGLLLVDPTSRPDRFARWHVLWDRWHAWLRERELTPLEACLGFVLSHEKVGRVVVGVDSVCHFREILENGRTQVGAIPDDLASEDLDLLTPSRWNTL